MSYKMALFTTFIESLALIRVLRHSSPLLAVVGQGRLCETDSYSLHLSSRPATRRRSSVRVGFGANTGLAAELRRFLWLYVV